MAMMSDPKAREPVWYLEQKIGLNKKKLNSITGEKRGRQVRKQVRILKWV